MQQGLHGDDVRNEAKERESEVDDSTLPCQKEEAERELRDLWDEECQRCSSYKPRLARQFIGELAEDLQELSQQTSQIRIRRLTPTEAERLQGFPDGWTEGISDTQRYKCLGNAVTVNVIEVIASKISELKE